MPFSLAVERRLLQYLVAVLALIPISAGFAGVLLGPSFLGVEDPPPADLDSHLRFLSGFFMAAGIAFWSCIPDIEHKTERFRLLALFTVLGGLARLLSLTEAGLPSAGHVIGLGMELAVVPVLVLWQARIARSYR